VSVRDAGPEESEAGRIVIEFSTRPAAVGKDEISHNTNANAAVFQRVRALLEALLGPLAIAHRVCLHLAFGVRVSALDIDMEVLTLNAAAAALRELGLVDPATGSFAAIRFKLTDDARKVELLSTSERNQTSQFSSLFYVGTSTGRVLALHAELASECPESALLAALDAAHARVMDVLENRVVSVDLSAVPPPAFTASCESPSLQDTSALVRGAVDVFSDQYNNQTKKMASKGSGSSVVANAAETQVAARAVVSHPVNIHPSDSCSPSAFRFDLATDKFSIMESHFVAAQSRLSALGESAIRPTLARLFPCSTLSKDVRVECSVAGSALKQCHELEVLALAVNAASLAMRDVGLPLAGHVAGVAISLDSASGRVAIGEDGDSHLLACGTATGLTLVEFQMSGPSPSSGGESRAPTIAMIAGAIGLAHSARLRSLSALDGIAPAARDPPAFERDWHCAFRPFERNFRSFKEKAELDSGLSVKFSEPRSAAMVELARIAETQNLRARWSVKQQIRLSGVQLLATTPEGLSRLIKMAESFNDQPRINQFPQSPSLVRLPQSPSSARAGSVQQSTNSVPHYTPSEFASSVAQPTAFDFFSAPAPMRTGRATMANQRNFKRGHQMGAHESRTSSVGSSVKQDSNAGQPNAQPSKSELDRLLDEI
jgi:hypothetical protein